MLPSSCACARHFTPDLLGDLYAEVPSQWYASQIAQELALNSVSFTLKIIKRRKKPVAYRFLVITEGARHVP